MGPHASNGHTPNLAHHFDTPEQQFDSGKLGMWIFLATEVLLFSGLFCAYAVYRANHPEIFMYAHQFLNKNLGAVNTVVLLCSSFTMAWAVRTAQLGKRRATVVLLCLTLAGGFGFMSIKFVEYKDKWEHGLLWGTRYVAQDAHGHGGEATGAGPAVPDAAAAPSTPPDAAVPAIQPDSDRTNVPAAAVGPTGTVAETGDEGSHGESRVVPRNVHQFFGIYFLMTGLHGIHVLAGMAAIAWIAVRAARGQFSAAYFTPVDLVGLYWHLVDLIWIFLFPLLYLIH